MKRASGPLVLVTLAILAIVGVVGITRPAGVLPPAPRSTAEATALPASTDGGSLDSLLDGVHVEHLMKHGR